MICVEMEINMPVAEQLTIHRALTAFCEQRARIEILGHRITDNVGKISGLHRQSALTRKQWGQNVVSLDAARTHIELACLFSDTAHLAQLARQLHEDFSIAAHDYLLENSNRKEALIATSACREVLLSSAMQSRVDAAIARCDKEVEQLMCLLDHSGKSVALLVTVAEQISGLRQ